MLILFGTKRFKDDMQLRVTNTNAIVEVVELPWDETGSQRN
jgi:hypothetical protein